MKPSRSLPLWIAVFALSASIAVAYMGIGARGKLLYFVLAPGTRHADRLDGRDPIRVGARRLGADQAHHPRLVKYRAERLEVVAAVVANDLRLQVE